jgi:exportin-T
MSNLSCSQAQKACFSILKKLVDLWAGLEGPEGFVEFMYEFIVPACFLAPSKPTFDLADAQTLLVLNETAACLKVVLDKRVGLSLLSCTARVLIPTELMPVFFLFW